MAIEGVGGSVIYFVDRYGPGEVSIYDVDFVPTDVTKGYRHDGVGLAEIDHVTHNVYRGSMNVWAGFYERLFNFREIKYFDIEGKLTGLKSRAMTSPCGKIRIPINESSDEKSQIAEYLDEYKGEGIQHIALSTDNIYETVERLRKSDVAFQSTIDTYYEGVDKRVPNHAEDLARLKKNQILIDGGPTSGLLLQIFTQNAIGPIFFEIIQRKGDIENKASVTTEMISLRHLRYTALIMVEIKAHKDITITPMSVIEAPNHLSDLRNYYAEIDRPHVLIPLLTSVGTSPSGKLKVAASNSFIFGEKHGAQPKLIHEDWDYNMHLAKFHKSLKAGETYKFALVAATVSSAQYEDPQNEAERLTIFAMLEGTDRLLKRHREAWTEIWKSDIVVDGQPAITRDIRFAL